MRISDWSSDVCSSDLNPDLIPTQLMLAGNNSRLNVDYPQGQLFKAPFAQQGLAVYSGRVVLHAALASATSVPGSLTLRESGRASVGKECVSTCRSWWSQYH